MRNFTATAVKEHLRSQVEDRDGPPELTQNEVELVRFICDGSFDWRGYLALRLVAGSAAAREHDQQDDDCRSDRKRGADPECASRKWHWAPPFTSSQRLARGVHSQPAQRRLPAAFRSR